jgi:hypothetical protein
MKATINNIIVEGNPEEIIKYQVLLKKDNCDNICTSMNGDGHSLTSKSKYKYIPEGEVIRVEKE